MNELELTGRARSHIIEIEQPRFALHYEVVGPFLAMRDAALTQGIDLQAVSGFRDFDRQVVIWNRKWRGERTLFDRVGKPLEHSALSEPELVDAILCWSAIPGGSRHHWGTDVDVVDAAAMPPGYQVQLVPAEYAADGVFGRADEMAGPAHAPVWFFPAVQLRPRRRRHRALAPELCAGRRRGHGGAVAEPCCARRSPAVHGWQAAVLDRLPEIYTRFILAIDPPARQLGVPKSPDSLEKPAGEPALQAPGQAVLRRPDDVEFAARPPRPGSPRPPPTGSWPERSMS